MASPKASHHPCGGDPLALNLSPTPMNIDSDLARTIHALLNQHDAAERRQKHRLTRSQPGPDRSYIDHAARLLVGARGTGEDGASKVAEALLRAVRSGALSAFDSTEELLTVDPLAVTVDHVVAHEEVNAWLAKMGKAVRLPTVGSAENREQRCLRLAQWCADEVRERGKRGAVQRVFEKEALRRPTADRSSVGKDIKAGQKHLNASPAASSVPWTVGTVRQPEAHPGSASPRQRKA